MGVSIIGDRRSKTYISFNTDNLTPIQKKAIRKFRDYQREDRQITNMAFYLFIQELGFIFKIGELSLGQKIDYGLFKLNFKWRVFKLRFRRWF